MGIGNAALARPLNSDTPPATDELEVTLIGPGYGESIVLHLGGGTWVVVDSCAASDGAPRPLEYLTSIGIDPSTAVKLIMATHWHDDHIRGIGRLVEVCEAAQFCCASALLQKEFLAIVGGLENRPQPGIGHGAREIHSVVSCLSKRRSVPVFAQPGRRIFMEGTSEIWSLSPSDAAFAKFLANVGQLVPAVGKTRARISPLRPNDAAIVSWVSVDDAAMLLGSDLERSGWIEILQSTTRPSGKAAVFKIPHHGSANAHEPKVWQEMLQTDATAALTPWRRGGHSLPTVEDIKRILSLTRNAYTTATGQRAKKQVRSRNHAVQRTLKESGVTIRQAPISTGRVRLRRKLNQNASWQVELTGSASHLNKMVNRVA